jgi:hypothetical protein
LPAGVQIAEKTEASGLERTGAMSVLDWLRKGFGFLLMSFGVSSPTRKPRPAAKPAAKPEVRR